LFSFQRSNLRELSVRCQPPFCGDLLNISYSSAMMQALFFDRLHFPASRNGRSGAFPPALVSGEN
ncbi:hypothetical protein, partial [Paenibacillus thermoaerophilus]|uniref:hypothetical protein n=1 Tax=Paenibacillus thermoaerophilus TaxID=1215385 RepID=UPI0036D231D3